MQLAPSSGVGAHPRMICHGNTRGDVGCVMGSGVGGSSCSSTATSRRQHTAVAGARKSAPQVVQLETPLELPASPRMPVRFVVSYIVVSGGLSNLILEGLDCAGKRVRTPLPLPSPMWNVQDAAETGSTGGRGADASAADGEPGSRSNAGGSQVGAPASTCRESAPGEPSGHAEHQTQEAAGMPAEGSGESGGTHPFPNGLRALPGPASTAVDVPATAAAVPAGIRDRPRAAHVLPGGDRTGSTNVALLPGPTRPRPQASAHAASQARPSTASPHATSVEAATGPSASGSFGDDGQPLPRAAQPASAPDGRRGMAGPAALHPASAAVAGVGLTSRYAPALALRPRAAHDPGPGPSPSPGSGPSPSGSRLPPPPQFRTAGQHAHRLKQPPPETPAAAAALPAPTAIGPRPPAAPSAAPGPADATGIPSRYPASSGGALPALRRPDAPPLSRVLACFNPTTFVRRSGTVRTAGRERRGLGAAASLPAAPATAPPAQRARVGAAVLSGDQAFPWLQSLRAVPPPPSPHGAVASQSPADPAEGGAGAAGLGRVARTPGMRRDRAAGFSPTVLVSRRGAVSVRPSSSSSSSAPAALFTGSSNSAGEALGQWLALSPGQAETEAGPEAGGAGESRAPAAAGGATGDLPWAAALLQSLQAANPADVARALAAAARRAHTAAQSANLDRASLRGQPSRVGAPGALQALQAGTGAVLPPAVPTAPTRGAATQAGAASLPAPLPQPQPHPQPQPLGRPRVALSGVAAARPPPPSPRLQRPDGGAAQRPFSLGHRLCAAGSLEDLSHVLDEQLGSMGVKQVGLACRVLVGLVLEQADRAAGTGAGGTGVEVGADAELPRGEDRGRQRSSGWEGARVFELGPTQRGASVLLGRLHRCLPAVQQLRRRLADPRSQPRPGGAGPGGAPQEARRAVDLGRRLLGRLARHTTALLAATPASASSPASSSVSLFSAASSLGGPAAGSLGGPGGCVGGGRMSRAACEAVLGVLWAHAHLAGEGDELDPDLGLRLELEPGSQAHVWAAAGLSAGLGGVRPGLRDRAAPHDSPAQPGTQPEPARSDTSDAELHPAQSQPQPGGGLDGAPPHGGGPGEQPQQLQGRQGWRDHVREADGAALRVPLHALLAAMWLDLLRELTPASRTARRPAGDAQPGLGAEQQQRGPGAPPPPPPAPPPRREWLLWAVWVAAHGAPSALPPLLQALLAAQPRGHECEQCGPGAPRTGMPERPAAPAAAGVRVLDGLGAGELVTVLWACGRFADWLAVQQQGEGTDTDDGDGSAVGVKADEGTGLGSEADAATDTGVDGASALRDGGQRSAVWRQRSREVVVSVAAAAVRLLAAQLVGAVGVKGTRAASPHPALPPERVIASRSSGATVHQPPAPLPAPPLAPPSRPHLYCEELLGCLRTAALLLDGADLEHQALVLLDALASQPGPRPHQLGAALGLLATWLPQRGQQAPHSRQQGHQQQQQWQQLEEEEEVGQGQGQAERGGAADARSATLVRLQVAVVAVLGGASREQAEALVGQPGLAGLGLRPMRGWYAAHLGLPRFVGSGPGRQANEGGGGGSAGGGEAGPPGGVASAGRDASRHGGGAASRRRPELRRRYQHPLPFRLRLLYGIDDAEAVGAEPALGRRPAPSQDAGAACRAPPPQLARSAGTAADAPLHAPAHGPSPAAHSPAAAASASGSVNSDGRAALPAGRPLTSLELQLAHQQRLWADPRVRRQPSGELLALLAALAAACEAAGLPARPAAVRCVLNALALRWLHSGAPEGEVAALLATLARLRWRPRAVVTVFTTAWRPFVVLTPGSLSDAALAGMAQVLGRLTSHDVTRVPDPGGRDRPGTPHRGRARGQVVGPALAWPKLRTFWTNVLALATARLLGPGGLSPLGVGGVGTGVARSRRAGDGDGSAEGLALGGSDASGAGVLPPAAAQVPVSAATLVRLVWSSGRQGARVPHFMGLACRAVLPLLPRLPQGMVGTLAWGVGQPRYWEPRMAEALLVLLRRWLAAGECNWTAACHVAWALLRLRRIGPTAPELADLLEQLMPVMHRHRHHHRHPAPRSAGGPQPPGAGPASGPAPPVSPRALARLLWVIHEAGGGRSLGAGSGGGGEGEGIVTAAAPLELHAPQFRAAAAFLARHALALPPSAMVQLLQIMASGDTPARLRCPEFLVSFGRLVERRPLWLLRSEAQVQLVLQCYRRIGWWPAAQVEELVGREARLTEGTRQRQQRLRAWRTAAKRTARVSRLRRRNLTRARYTTGTLNG